MGLFDVFKGSSGSSKLPTNQPPSKTGGPVVKTGPTSGQNRSRNDDGRWRAKRSDSGQPRKP